MTEPELESLREALGRLWHGADGLEACETLLQHPSACVRSTTAFLLSRMRRHAGVREVLERESLESPDSVVRHFAALPGG